MEQEIISWIYEAAERIKAGLGDALKVDQKSGRTDLVTNVDKETQDFIASKIKAFDPEAKILGEENGQDETRNIELCDAARKFLYHDRGLRRRCRTARLYL